MSSNLPADPRLPARQARAISTFVETGRVSETLTKCDLSRSTWKRWRQNAKFEEALSFAVSEAFADSLLAVKAANAEAVETLIGGMRGTKDGQQVASATQLLIYSLRVAALVDNESRLRALEVAAGLRKGRPGQNGPISPGGAR
jgi:hypothetical protein